MLYDNHGRIVNYLRIAITDRCNLRCHYCMPEEGIQYVDREELMSYEELLRISKLLVGQGINKIRITGGEPFLRKDLMDFLRQMSLIEGLKSWHITTNGVLTAPHIPELKRLGVGSVNLSLDSIDPQRFFEITRRDELDKVLHCLEELLRHNISTKINMVVMAGQNIGDILPMIELTRDRPIQLRLLEEMPFNGSDNNGSSGHWTHVHIRQYIQEHYPSLSALPNEPHATAARYQIAGYKGDVGIIASYSRTFCGTCNRLRLTPVGTIKTCLYDDGIFNIKSLLRAGADDEAIALAILQAIGHRAKDGHEAEQNRINTHISESMAMIGG